MPKHLIKLQICVFWCPAIDPYIATKQVEERASGELFVGFITRPMSEGCIDPGRGSLRPRAHEQAMQTILGSVALGKGCHGGLDFPRSQVCPAFASPSSTARKTRLMPPLTS